MLIEVQKDVGILLDNEDKNINKIISFVQRANKEDKCVFIASPNGRKRCALCMFAYLIHRYHWPVHRAIQYVKAFRPQTDFKMILLLNNQIILHQEDKQNMENSKIYLTYNNNQNQIMTKYQ